MWWFYTGIVNAAFEGRADLSASAMATSESDQGNKKASPEFIAAAASELNNLLQIIAGSSSALEPVAKTDQHAPQHFAMIQASVERAETLALEMAKQSVGAAQKSIRYSEIA